MKTNPKLLPEQDLKDELRPSYKVDYSKSRPNRFAGRKKIVTGSQHGGARRGAGRKPSKESLERHTITLLKSDALFLRKLDKRLSIAIRKLIAERRTAR